MPTTVDDALIEAIGNEVERRFANAVEVHSRLVAIEDELGLEHESPFSTMLRAAQENADPTDEELESLELWLIGQTDAELVATFLTAHKMAENAANGMLRRLLRGQARAITIVLSRFAPEAFVAGLSVYFEHVSDDEGEGEDPWAAFGPIDDPEEGGRDGVDPSA